MAQGLSTSDPFLSPTHLSIRRGRATTTHYTHHQVSLMVSRNTTLVPSLGLRINPACETGLSAGIRRERVPPQRRERESSTILASPHQTGWQYSDGDPPTGASNARAYEKSISGFISELMQDRAIVTMEGE